MDFDLPVNLSGDHNLKQQSGVLSSCQEAPTYRSDYQLMWVDRNVDSDENMIYRSCFNKLNFKNLKTINNPDFFTEHINNIV